MSIKSHKNFLVLSIHALSLETGQTFFETISELVELRNQQTINDVVITSVQESYQQHQTQVEGG